MLDIERPNSLFFKHFSGALVSAGGKPAATIAGVPNRIYLYYGFNGVPNVVTNENPTTGDIDNTDTYVYNPSTGKWTASALDFNITGTSKIQTSAAISGSYSRICYYFWDYITEYETPSFFHYPTEVRGCSANTKPVLTVSALPNRIYVYNMGTVFTNENPTTGEINNNNIYQYAQTTDTWTLTSLHFTVSSSAITVSAAISSSVRYLCWMYDYA